VKGGIEDGTQRMYAERLQNIEKVSDLVDSRLEEESFNGLSTEERDRVKLLAIGAMV